MKLLFPLMGALFLFGCSKGDKPAIFEFPVKDAPMSVPNESDPPDDLEVVTFGGGSFWGVEEIFHQTKGVYSAVSGYMGGLALDANYKAVSAGGTNHAEAVQVHYDPKEISFSEVLNVFWHLHDPTQLNKQGPDYGRHYRSVIFYHTEEQHALAEEARLKLNESRQFGDTIVTEIVPAMEFYKAEDPHQNFARRNPENPFVQSQLLPKLRELGLKIPGGADAKQPKGSAPQ